MESCHDVFLAAPELLGVVNKREIQLDKCVEMVHKAGTASELSFLTTCFPAAPRLLAPGRYQLDRRQIQFTEMGRAGAQDGSGE